MDGGNDQPMQQQAMPNAPARPMAQALEMAQYPAFMPGQQNMLADQMTQFYGGPVDEYRTMLAQNTQAAQRPTLRTPTDIETYLNSLANPGGAPSAASSNPAAAGDGSGFTNQSEWRSPGETSGGYNR